jgi:CRP/FNR family transcriptional regulator
MINKLQVYLQEHTDLTSTEIDRIIYFAVERKLRRNEFALHEGDICRHKLFIISGLLRVFNITADGSEHITRFSEEMNWTVDKESYDLGTPARTSICAVEPSTILVWLKSDFDKLTDELPALKNFLAQITTDNIYESSQRLLTTLSATPDERYQDFVQKHPLLLSRLPIKMIAAYLGMSKRTLDRIRHTTLSNR